MFPVFNRKSLSIFLNILSKLNYHHTNWFISLLSRWCLVCAGRQIGIILVLIYLLYQTLYPSLYLLVIYLSIILYTSLVLSFSSIVTFFPFNSLQLQASILLILLNSNSLVPIEFHQLGKIYFIMWLPCISHHSVWEGQNGGNLFSTLPPP